MGAAALPDAPRLADDRGLRRLVRTLAAAPVTVPCAVVVVLLVAWAQADGGQPLTTWAPGALAVLGLLGVTAAGLPGGWSSAPRAVRAAVVLLGAFTAWSALSILWADDQGAAWEGTNRTLLYLAVFTLFALWPQRPRTAAWLLGAWTLGMGVLAAVTVLCIPGVADPAALFVDDRLDEPAGYPNAAAATWLLAFWPALAFAASSRVPAGLRAVFAASAVVLADLALLSQSRGSLLATPITLVLFLALVPGRTAHVLTLVPIAAAVGLAAPTLLDVGEAVVAGDAQGEANAMARAVVLGALAAGLVVLLAAAGQQARPPGTGARRAATYAAAALCAAVAAGGLVAAGNPVDRVESAWESFKGGYAEGDDGGSRLASGLGSNRYDFYRVALGVFADHPVVGTGADTYFQDYLARGESSETPRYPHSLPLRTLQQLGIVGALLLLGAFAAALAAVWRALRVGDPLGRAVAGGAAGTFAYWCVHGSADWFWEFAGLGATAFALLGLACALAPRTATAAGTGAAAPARRRPGTVAVAAGLVVAAVSTTLPWLAERDVVEAGAVHARRPFESYDRLRRAASLNRLSDRPYLVEGSIALRYGDLDRADEAFADALARNPRGQYATLERGAIASVRGERRRALALLRRAVALAPRDPQAREALKVVEEGGAVDLLELNRRIREGAAALEG